MKNTLIIVVVILISVSCKKAPQGPQGENGTKGPDGAVGSIATGTIAGSVVLYDENGAKTTTGLNTVTVSIKGTNFNAVCDEKGFYSISKVPTGIHVLEFKGSNTQVYKNDQVSFAGNGIIYVNADIYVKPTWNFSTALVEGSTSVIKITAAASPTVANDRYFLVIFGTSQNLTNTDPSSYDYSYIYKLGIWYQNYNVINPGTGVLTSPGYPSGTTFYAKMYPVSSLYNAKYTDAATQKPVYYAVGDVTSFVFTLTMP